MLAPTRPRDGQSCLVSLALKTLLWLLIAAAALGAWAWWKSGPPVPWWHLLVPTVFGGVLSGLVCVAPGFNMRAFAIVTPLDTLAIL
jgi:hypothetical protein